MEGGNEGMSALALARLHEEFGKELVLITPQEAHEQGLRMEDFANVPTMRIEAPPLMHLPVPLGTMKSGKTRRRERRAAERRARKGS